MENERLREILNRHVETTNAYTGADAYPPYWEVYDHIFKAMQYATAEATAALRARVRAQAIVVSGMGRLMCVLCNCEWEPPSEAEVHDEFEDAQPCAAEVGDASSSE